MTTRHMESAARQLATLLTGGGEELVLRGAEESLQSFRTRRDAQDRYHKIYAVLLVFASACVDMAQEERA